MKATIQLSAEARSKTGRGDARALRRAGRIPAVLYSKNQEPLSFSLAANELNREYYKGAFESKLIEVKLDGKSYFAVARDLQTHPVSDKIEHLDFLHVEKDSKVAIKVPVRVINADKSIGLKRGGSLNVVRHTVDLICSPESIPTKIIVDVKEAKIGDSIHISHIELPAGATPAIRDRDFTVATITGRVKAEDAAADAAAEGAAA